MSVKVCCEHCFRQGVSCRPHLRVSFGSQVLFLKGRQCKVVNFACENSNLIESYLGRVGFVNLGSVEIERATMTTMDVARKPIASGNFHCAIRFFNRGLRVLCVVLTIFIIRDQQIFPPHLFK